MKYIVKRMLANGQVEWLSVDALSVKEAHERANVLRTDGATVKIYADTTTAEGIYAAAIWIVKAATAKAVRDTSLTFFEHIRNETSTLNNYTGYLSASDINYLIAKTTADTQDFIAKAYEGIIDGLTEGIVVDGQYSLAFKKVNSYYKENRNISTKEASTEYIQATGGDLIAVDRYISRIIHGGERFTPAENGKLNAATIRLLGNTLSDFTASLSERQKNIIRLTANGYSQPQVAEKIGCGVGTVAEHITKIRGKALEYFEDNAPELVNLVDVNGVRRAYEKRQKHRDKK